MLSCSDEVQISSSPLLPATEEMSEQSLNPSKVFANLKAPTSPTSGPKTPKARAAEADTKETAPMRAPERLSWIMRLVKVSAAGPLVVDPTSCRALKAAQRTSASLSAAAACARASPQTSATHGAANSPKASAAEHLTAAERSRRNACASATAPARPAKCPKLPNAEAT
eukprot:CAMPEP_0203920744 /NCGR_PEP_ID=MMETSP0359-20131031/61006_1 /ASSEMBLY_ACC=CAM_ASM_000338 /TAXON_ID=268821 /ORGANISM="Scrippsiella Hangoei, Strain SHTV-5" /LENGTH=168 /DNA_ID=CAMNT_0050848303 /DNA_START=38 /DNA_END=544 /DNA_ORIENTATION=+